MRTVQMTLVSLLAVLAWGWSSGCSDNDHERHRPVAVERRVPEVVRVEPGYYYDREYYDDLGALHPRTYYHYDGNRWDRADAVPRGNEARERPMAMRGDRGGQERDRREAPVERHDDRR